jgi:cytosine/adenosine deaminase-related metal-dependent hydrolase
MSDGAHRADLVIRDAELLVTMTGEEVRGGWVAIDAGFVTAVGHPGEEPEGREILSAAGCLVTPGLINTHHHIYQNLTRSFGPAVNADFLDWWTTLGGIWTRLDEEASYVSAWIGLAELALGGCTTTTDHLYIHPHEKLIDAEIAAAREVGVRFHPVRGAMDMALDEGALPREHYQDADTILSDCERLVKTHHDRSPGAMVRIALGPCSTFDSSDALMREAAELAERLDVRLHTHLAQVPPEEAFSLEHFGQRPVDRFEALGWGNDRAWVAHCIFVNHDEMRRLGRWGTGVSHCPSSNSLICVGIAPVRELRAAGAPVGLGCDGSASTDHASMWLEARTALLLGRLRHGATGMSARDVLSLGTTGSAACLGRTGEIGVLAPGACGDVVAWPLEGVLFAGAWSDPVEAWLRCGPIAARHTVVAGKLVVRDGALIHARLEEVLRDHERISRAWQSSTERAPTPPARSTEPARAAS